MAPGLLDLPSELIEAVAKWSTAIDNKQSDQSENTLSTTFANLRLVHPVLEVATRQLFSRDHFKRRKLRLDSDGLHELVAISKSAKLAGTVRTIEVVVPRISSEGLAPHSTLTAVLFPIAMQGLRNGVSLDFRPIKSGIGTVFDDDDRDVYASSRAFDTIIAASIGYDWAWKIINLRGNARLRDAGTLAAMALSPSCLRNLVSLSLIFLASSNDELT